MLGGNETAWYALLAGVAIKSTLVLGAAWLAAFLLRGRSAAVRHLVWTAAFAALLALPFLSVSLPALHVPLGKAFLPPPAFETTASASPQAPVSVERPRVSAPVPGGNPPWRAGWRSALLLVWAAGAAAGLARMLLAWVVVRRMRRSANPFPVPDLPAFAQPLGIAGGVDVLETRRGTMPMTFGLFRPAVLMPAGAGTWSEERCLYVLLHELAHVRRGDTATHLMARFTLCLYWWHPLAWRAWREFLKERERAADDLVLSAGARPPEYADHLLQVARSMQSPAATGWAAVAMARPSQLEGRLLAILDHSRNRRAPRRVFAVAAMLLA